MSIERTGIAYNEGGDTSSIGAQLVDYYYYKKPLIDRFKHTYFGQLSSTINMPKHMGKTIKRYHILNIMDDRNINDQGIDALGRELKTDEFTVKFYGKVFTFAVEADATAAAAAVNAVESGVAVKTGSATPWTVTLSKDILDNYATTAQAEAIGFAFGDKVNLIQNSGNFYADSRDVGTILKKLSTLTEHGGRVNRVGVTRMEVEGSIENFGFYMEYTKDSLQFDTDEELLTHIVNEAVLAANKQVEDLLQLDLINGAGVIVYGGNATAEEEITGATGSTASKLTYELLETARELLDENECPDDTTIITGSRMIDTKVINSARYVVIGSALEKDLKKMTDYHGDKAFIEVQHYADAGNIANGEIGCVGNFRFIKYKNMMVKQGAGALEGTNGGYRATGGRYDIHHALIVGNDSFNTIGFQTDGKTVKMEVIHKKPGVSTADRYDPYGKKGFYSTQWWYGTLINRPEWICLLKVVASI